jgi:threonine aldolase
VLAALADANGGAAAAYGDDTVTSRLEASLAALFEHEVAVFPVATGTAANALALSALAPPWSAILCHREAHIAAAECGAPEFFTGGARLVLLEGEAGKLSAAALEAECAHTLRPHRGAASAVSLSQATEAGAVYTPAEIAALSEICRGQGLKLHVDGARFANAVAALGCSPAEASWKSGVDALSFGLTKNGAMAAEAVIFFDPALARDFDYRRKRGGHLFSKMRFVSAQFQAMLEDDLWLRLAAHANAMARRLAERLVKLPGVRLAYPVESNQLFVSLPEPAAAALESRGFLFHRWETPSGRCVRLVTAFDTRREDVDRLTAETAGCLQEIGPPGRNL